MGKGKFIAGTILSAISIVCCAFGNLLLLKATRVSDLPGVAAAIVFIVFAFALFAFQFACGVVAEILLWMNVRKSGFAKTASIVLASVCAAAILASLVIYILSALSGSGNVEPVNAIAAILLKQNILQNI